MFQAGAEVLHGVYWGLGSLYVLDLKLAVVVLRVSVEDFDAALLVDGALGQSGGCRGGGVEALQRQSGRAHVDTAVGGVEDEAGFAHAAGWLLSVEFVVSVCVCVCVCVCVFVDDFIKLKKKIEK